MRDTIKAFKALSDETRLRILNVLLKRECCVCEVMQALDISQTRASRNLGTLYDAGFLNLRKDGLWSLYSIDKEGMKDYLTILYGLDKTPEPPGKIIDSGGKVLLLGFAQKRKNDPHRLFPICLAAI